MRNLRANAAFERLEFECVIDRTHAQVNELLLPYFTSLPALNADLLVQCILIRRIYWETSIGRLSSLSLTYSFQLFDLEIVRVSGVRKCKDR